MFEYNCSKTSSQAPSYARRVQSETMTYSLTYSLTGVKCRATSVAKKTLMITDNLKLHMQYFSDTVDCICPDQLNTFGTVSAYTKK